MKLRLTEIIDDIKKQRDAWAKDIKDLSEGFEK